MTFCIFMNMIYLFKDHYLIFYFFAHYLNLFAGDFLLFDSHDQSNSNKHDPPDVAQTLRISPCSYSTLSMLLYLRALQLHMVW